MLNRLALIAPSFIGLPTCHRAITTSASVMAARKGTRERKRALLVKQKNSAVKKEVAPKKGHRLRLRPQLSRKPDESNLPSAIDDVYMSKWFRSSVFNIEEAIEMHRETHHPTLHNQPDATIHATLELDMQMDKKTKYIELVRGVIPLQYPFSKLPNKTTLVLTKSSEEKLIAMDNGADKVGGLEVIKLFQDGALTPNSFNYVIAHSDISLECTPLRGMLKKKYPNLSDGTVTSDLPYAIKRFKTGLEFESERDTIQLDYGTLSIPFGQLDIPLSQLVENFRSVIQHVESKTPRGHSKPLITRVYVWCKPKGESFFIDFEKMMQSKQEEELKSIEAIQS